MSIDIGRLNGHATGIVMKELVRRVIQMVRRKRFAFEATAKMSYAGEVDGDVFTDVDVMAQTIYLRGLMECFPDCGIIGEEQNLRIKSKNGLYFTLDPIDGTKAFIRRQSHGISTMISLVWEGQVIAAYIGDINTQEIFGYRPGSGNVWRINEQDVFQRLPVRTRVPDFSRSYALLREPFAEYPPECQSFVSQFKNHEVMGSSIGTWAARLWKGEVQALLLRPGYETPWDSSPIIGISSKLGCRFYAIDQEGRLSEVVVEVPLETYPRDFDLLIM